MAVISSRMSRMQQVEVDGQWYRSFVQYRKVVGKPGYTSTGGTIDVIRPGEEWTDVEVALAPRLWQKAGTNDLNLSAYFGDLVIMPAGEGPSSSFPQTFALTPGKHTVRVAFVVELGREFPPGPSALRVISNPVELEVQSNSPISQPKRQTFTARFPQGQIRLVALSRLAPASPTWWLPDGTVCSQSFDAEWGYLRENDSIVQLILEKQGFPNRSSFFYKVTPASCSTRGESMIIRSAGKLLLNCEAMFVDVPKPDATNALKQFTVQAGVASGEGTVVFTNGTKGGIGASGMSLPDGASFNLMSSGPVDGNGFVSLTFSHTQLTNWDVRITALDQAGKVREPVTYGTTTVDAMAQTHARFEGLLLSSVKEFRFEVRPYRWIEFRNISLQPGERTHFEIVETGKE